MDAIATIQRVVNEHVPMPGMPTIIVTRWFCYQWLKLVAGWNPCERGFGSIDYAAFGRPATTLPLTEDTERDKLLALLAGALERENG